MFKGFNDSTIDFMWNIRFHNEKSWFEKHKEEYKNVLERPMRELAHEVYGSFAEAHAELNLQLHISRIYRDARRLHGRGPFKDHLWFSLRQHCEEWTDKPVFWFELAPETWSYGMGYYQARALTMRKLRARIDAQPEKLAQLDRRLSRQKEFVLRGDEYVRPKCEPGSTLSNWYNKKSFSLVHEEKVGRAVASPALAGRIGEGFTFLLPFYQYFAALDGDPIPGEKAK